MTVLFQFSGVSCADWEKSYSFSLGAGEIRQLQVATQAEKDAVLDVALGNGKCAEGAVLLQGVPLGDNVSGSVGWVAASGGLISNLKVWENVTLPLWYHEMQAATDTEQRITYWLTLLGMAEEEWEGFMGATPDTLRTWQRKLAGLLRGLVQKPQVLVVDADLFEGVESRLGAAWRTALERFAEQGRAVLVVADRESALHWKMIE